MNLRRMTPRNCGQHREEKKEIIHLFHPSQVYSEDLTELLEVFTYVEPR